MNYLGTIVVPAASSKNNRSTSTPFAIPRDARRLILVLPAEASGWCIRTGIGAALLSDSNQINQGVSGASLQVPLPLLGDEPVVAIYNAGGGGSVKVYVVDDLVLS